MSFQFGATEQATYDLAGDSLSDAARAIDAMDEAGRTEWFPAYAFTTSGDVLDTATVRVRTRITTPRWTGYARAPQRDRHEWDRFVAALLTHERGHVDLVRRSLCDVDRQLVGLTEDAAASAWEDALAALQTASDAYDTETDHGRLRGTVIELGT